MCLFACDRRTRLQGIGYALYCAWTFFLSFKMPALCFPNNPNGLFMVFFTAGALAGVLVTCAASRLHGPLASRHGLTVCIGLLGTVGCLTGGLGAFLPAGSDALPAFIGVALSGFASILLVSVWLEAFISYGLERVVRNYLVGMCLGALLYCPISFCPTPVATALCAALPFASSLTACLSCTFKESQGVSGVTKGSSGDEGAQVPDKPRATKVVARLLTVVALVSLSVTTVRSSILSTGLASLFYGGFGLLPVFLQAAASIIAKLIVTREYAMRMTVVFYTALSALALCSLSLLSPTFIPALAAITFSLTVLSGQLVSFLVVFRIAEEHGHPDSPNNSLVSIGLLNVALTAPSILGLVLVDSLSATLLMFAAMLCALASSFVVMGNADAFTLARQANEPPGRLEAERRRKVEQIARQYNLTPREQEVLELWGTGHSSPYIERQLSITKNTVKTHTAHIYAKTGTSSKEELVQLVNPAGSQPSTSGESQV